MDPGALGQAALLRACRSRRLLRDRGQL